MIEHPVSAFYAGGVEPLFAQALSYAELSGEKEDLEDLLRVAKSLYRVWLGRGGRKSPPGRTKSVSVTPRLKGRELERVAAYEEYVAKIAAADPSVYCFREQILGGYLLTEDQARHFVRSAAARFLRFEDLEFLRIPPVSHDAELRDYKRDRKGGMVQHSGIVSVKDPKLEIPVNFLPNDKGHLPVLHYVNEEGYARGIRVSLGSVLDKLRELSEKLSNAYAWQEARATWFVLTGAIPAVRPVNVGYQLNKGTHLNRGEITLTVAPWVPAEIVSDIYRNVQRRVLGNRDNQPLREKNLRLLRFVLERTDPVGLLKESKTDVPDSDWMGPEELIANLRYEKMPEGQELVAEWDAQEWVQKDPKNRAYGEDTRRFWRDYHRARRGVAYPAYQWPHKV